MIYFLEMETKHANYASEALCCDPQFCLKCPLRLMAKDLDDMGNG